MSNDGDSGLQSDIKLLIKQGYHPDNARLVAKSLIRNQSNFYKKKMYKEKKWFLARYFEGKLIDSKYYMTIPSIKKDYPELHFITIKMFLDTVEYVKPQITAKYGSIKIRKIRGKNSFKNYLLIK